MLRAFKTCYQGSISICSVGFVSGIRGQFYIQKVDHDEFALARIRQQLDIQSAIYIQDGILFLDAGRSTRQGSERPGSDLPKASETYLPESRLGYLSSLRECIGDNALIKR